MQGVAALRRKMSPFCSAVQGPYVMNREPFEMNVIHSFKMLGATYLAMQRDVRDYRNA